ncbi:MAG: endolytic transglycosylase MltG [Pseudomonadota bacterium]
MWRHIASNFLTLAVVGLILIVGAIGWAQSQYRGGGPLEAAICLRVSAGSNMYRVSEDLSAQNAISHPSIFRAGADYQDLSQRLKAGSFLIPAGASMEEIVAKITGGGQSTCGTEINFRIGIARAEVQVRELDPETQQFSLVAEFDPGEGAAPAAYMEAREDADARYRITLAEGVTSFQVVEELKQADFLEGEVLPVPDEGTLAPDSYEVRAGGARSDLVGEMQARQAAILAGAWAGRAEGLPLTSAEDALILASIIEKETGIADERRRIASVFINRLDQGMRLQTDPTVIYGITRGEGSLGRGIRQSELRRETPWNTYVIDGLPPTPIANPGRASIEAAVNPDGSDFIFFVADGSGGHAFSRTLSEHNANVAKWRAIEAERSGN